MRQTFSHDARLDFPGEFVAIAVEDLVCPPLNSALRRSRSHGILTCHNGVDSLKDDMRSTSANDWILDGERTYLGIAAAQPPMTKMSGLSSLPRRILLTLMGMSASHAPKYVTARTQEAIHVEDAVFDLGEFFLVRHCSEMLGLRDVVRY